MSELKIIRASAGSGKTFKITAEYLSLLFRNPFNYRHILAVTFTNKATEEMKSRILSELHTIATGGKSAFTDLLRNEFELQPAEIRLKARLILEQILHNYSRFSISTIDSFFQRIIKAFAREAGIQYSFEVELNTANILEKAAEQLLEKVESDNGLLNWLTTFAEKRIEDGRNWDFKKQILQLGKQLFNEDFKSLPQPFHQKIDDRAFLEQIQNEIFALRASFLSKIKDAGLQGSSIMTKHHLTPDDFKYGKSGTVGSFFIKLKHGQLPDIGSRITNACNTIDAWLPKDKVLAAQVQQAANDGLYSLLNNTVAYITENSVVYNTCNSVLSHFYTLGILADLNREIHVYAAENDVFILANAASFLQKIIGDNDAPFIYEKTGQNYFHYMIDEFQDTSGIQWNNFKPLIANSLASNNFSMLVGDVKQSIYRWRNTDWKIMAHAVANDMNMFGVTSENLAYNWRSKGNIIAFNNTLFDVASQWMQNKFNAEMAESSISNDDAESISHIIKNAYADCLQIPGNKETSESGFISVAFVENESAQSEALNSMTKHIDELLTLGYNFKDIAILVRKATEGRAVIDHLNGFNSPENTKYSVLSNESAFLHISPAINLIMKTFKYLNNPDDAINTYALLDEPYFISKHPSKAINPSDILPYNELLLLTPSEIFEKLIAVYQLTNDVQNLPYIQAFADVLLDFENRNIASVPAFVDYWNDNGDTFSITASDEQNAIKMITIHKSKGLEYPNVIIPFCNWSIDHTPTLAPTIWCRCVHEPFNKLEYFPIEYTSKLKNSLFAVPYINEKANSYFDNLNLLYVALTRAADNLFVLAPLPKKEGAHATIGELLYLVLNTKNSIAQSRFPGFQFGIAADNNTFTYGTLELQPKKTTHTTTDLPLVAYPTFPIKERLKQKSVAPGFWQNNWIEGRRSFGNLMHVIFQEIKTYSDIEKAVLTVQAKGLVAFDEVPALTAEIKSLLSVSPYSEWFDESWQVLTEAAIVVPNQHQYRPDRVMIRNNEVVVIDYKFGNTMQTSNNEQVAAYVAHITQMPYKSVKGYIWYVRLNKVKAI